MKLIFLFGTAAGNEQRRRIDAPGRGEFGKLRSADLLAALSMDFAAAEAAMPAAALTLDMDLNGPEEAAARIAELI